MTGRKRATAPHPGTRPAVVPAATTRQEEPKVTTPDPGAQTDPNAPAPKARKAKVSVPTMSEGTRQEVEIYGRGVDPFTGGIFRKNKETGEVEFIPPGEPDPDAKPTAPVGRA